MTALAKTVRARTKTVRSSPTAATALYLYAISQVPKRLSPTIAAEGVDGVATVEAVVCGDYLCWISRVSKTDFADRITEKMHELEWLAAASLRHQRVVAEVSSKLPSLPARFATVFLSEASLMKHINGRNSTIRAAFARVTDADEWGVKIFALSQFQSRALRRPASGAEYLKRKAELLQPRKRKSLDEDVQQFISDIAAVAVASTPGGKASAGQPGLVWHGSFLVRNRDRAKLDAVLKKYARKWKGLRRIDCSGPWPPYSFVGEHV